MKFLETQKYKLQKYRNTKYRYPKRKITERQRKIYRYTEIQTYRYTEIQITVIQKYSNIGAEIQISGLQ